MQWSERFSLTDIEMPLKPVSSGQQLCRGTDAGIDLKNKDLPGFINDIVQTVHPLQRRCFHQPVQYGGKLLRVFMRGLVSLPDLLEPETVRLIDLAIPAKDMKLFAIGDKADRARGAVDKLLIKLAFAQSCAV